jgi:Ca2+/Na+ antiporter
MMTTNQTRSIKSILLLAGSFTFAFLLGELVHEYGHYLGHLAYGNPDNVQVHVDPFGGTMILGVTSLPDKIISVTSATGPLFNLLLAVTCLLLLWRIRRPALLPFLLWGPIAMIQEGVNSSLGMMTPGGDAQWIAALGIPKPIIVLSGSFLLVAGVKTISLLLPLTDIQRDAPFRDKFLIVLLGMCSLMFIRFIHSVIASPVSVMENLVPLIFSLLLAVFVVLSYKPSSKGTHAANNKSKPVTWLITAFSLALGLSLFVFQMFVW